jgi:hypothetical protein
MIDVAYRHLTEIEGLPVNVRFRGNSGHVLSSFYEYTLDFARPVSVE